MNEAEFFESYLKKLPPEKQAGLRREQFSVYQFFADGTHERVREFVNVQEAVKAAWHYSNSVAARMGMVNRVIITDSGDCIAWEWTLPSSS